MEKPEECMTTMTPVKLWPGQAFHRHHDSHGKSAMSPLDCCPRSRCLSLITMIDCARRRNVCGSILSSPWQGLQERDHQEIGETLFFLDIVGKTEQNSRGIICEDKVIFKHDHTGIKR
jgi:hypothetical protein